MAGMTTVSPVSEQSDLWAKNVWGDVGDNILLEQKVKGACPFNLAGERCKVEGACFSMYHLCADFAKVNVMFFGSRPRTNDALGHLYARTRAY